MRYRRTLRYEPLEDRRLLATVTVNTLADTVDLNDGLTSLREAIFATNLVAGPDTIVFSVELSGSDPVTLNLTLGELRITDSVTINSRSGFHTIDASGSDPTPDQKNGDGSRVFVIDNGNDSSAIDVRFSGLVITGGDVTGDGGAILNRENLWLADTDVTGSSAISDDIARLSTGGGIAHRLGTLRVTEGVIAENSADFGGGIHVESGTLLVDLTIISRNSGVSGSGVYIAAGDATIARSSIRDNTAGAFSLGGGIYSSGSLRVDATTISGNSASFGGGIFTRTDSSEVVLISQSTISGNTAFDRGGGIRNAAGTMFIDRSTITGNTAPVGDGGGVASRGYANSRTEIHATIIAGNKNSDVDFGTGDLNTFVSLGENLVGFGNAIAEFDAAGDRTGIADPRLGPLADNGGPNLPDGSKMLTHALLPGSPAINAGDLNSMAGAGVPPYDQRGAPFARIVNGRIDIGAIEFQEASDLNLVVDRIADESDGNVGTGNLSLREAIELANQWPSTDTIRFDPALTTTRAATILLKLGELKVTDDVVIRGPGAKLLTIDASGLDPTPGKDVGDGGRAFQIDDGQLTGSIDVLLSGMTLTGGDTTDHGGAIASFESLVLHDMWFTGNSTQMSGGGIYEVGPTMITNCRFVDNLADIGAGVFLAGHGEISDSHFIDNAARSAAGAVYAGRLPGRDSRTGSLTVSASMFDNNSAALGGAIQAFFPAAITTTRFRFNAASDSGGALWSSAGNSANPLVVTDSEFTQNRAELAGGAMFVHTMTSFQPNTAVVQASNFSLNRADNGGAIYVDGNARVAESQIIGNSSADDGGGVYVESFGNLTIEQTRIEQNLAARRGGGIYSDGQLSLTGSDVLGNRAEGFEGAGGGIYSRRELTLVGTAVGNNFATSQAGGIFHTTQPILSDESLIADSSTIFDNHTEGVGGGLFLDDLLGGTIVNSTISGNSANLTGGGIELDTILGRTLRILHSTIVQNSADADQNGTGSGGGIHADGLIQLSNSILALNSANGLPSDAEGSPIQARYSLISNNDGSGLAESPAGATDVNGNLVGGPLNGLIDPSLGPLAENGGPTATHELLSSSPALDAADPILLAGIGGVSPFDQRGAPFTRKFGERIDIGAFERQPLSLAGDFNTDGVIDAADYTLWRDTRGSTTDFRADGDGNGVIDDADRLMWRANFGRTSNSVEQGAESRKFESDAIASNLPALPVGLSAVAQLNSEKSLFTRRLRAVGSRLTAASLFDHDAPDGVSLLAATALQKAIDHESSGDLPQSPQEKDEEPRDVFDAHSAVLDCVFDALGET